MVELNCVYCPEYKPIYSAVCQGYMDYCIKYKKKINCYEDIKNCKYNIIKNILQDLENVKNLEGVDWILEERGSDFKGLMSEIELAMGIKKEPEGSKVFDEILDYVGKL